MKHHRVAPLAPKVRLSLRKLVACSAWGILALVPHSATAQNLLTNGSLENTGGTFVNNGQGFMNLAVGSAVLPGWTVTNNQISWINNANGFALAAVEGTFFLDLTGTQDNANFGGITQTFATTPSDPYTLTLSLGSGGTTGPYGGTKSVLVTAGSSSTTFTLVPTGTGNQWGEFSFGFVATGTSTAITIRGSASGSGNQYVGLDNVTVIPEPGSGAFVLLGVGALIFSRRSHRKPSGA